MKKIALVIPAPSDKNIQIEVIKNLEKKNFNIIIERGSNPSANRNRGIKKSKEELVAFTNIHSKLSNNWQEEVIKFFKNNPSIDAVGGPQFTSDKEVFQRASGYAMQSLFGAAIVSRRYRKNKENLNSDETEITSANLICRKKVFKKVTFNEKLYPGEDPRFIQDLKKEGFKVAYSPKIIVYNKRRSDIISLAKQIYGYGLTRPKKESIKETITKPYFFVPTIFLIYLLSLIPLFILSRYFLLPLIAYAFLNIIAIINNIIKTKDFRASIIMPLIFLIIHLSYGLGIFEGLVNKVLSSERTYN